MAITAFSAVVLVAGHSTRMGRDKALLERDGIPMWRRQREVLASAGASEIFLSARPDQAWVRATSGFTAVLHDALPGAGPLCGLTAGIERAAHGHVAVLAIDLPRMDAAWFRRLLDQCAAGVGAVGRRGDTFEPLAAIYPREWMPIAWEALVAAKYALQPVVREGVERGLLRVDEITPADLPRFENWNTPEAVA